MRHKLLLAYDYTRLALSGNALIYRRDKVMTIDYRVRESGIAVPAGVDVQILERIAELEFASEDIGWIDLGSAGEGFEFSRNFVQSIVRTARLTWLKNPIVQRGVNVKADYIFGRQVNIHAPDEAVNEVIQAFLNDTHNQTEFTAQAARIQKERELQTDGNIFFVLIPHLRTGKVRIRTIDVEEITDIITDPNDRKASWYYKREYNEQTFNYATGANESRKKTVYYRDWRNVPTIPRTVIGDAPVISGQYIYHIKVGGFSNWKFGISEIYSALDWTKAYKVFLENWSTIVAAYARFAFKVTTTGGKPGVDQAVKRLSTTQTTTQSESNPKPTTGSSFVRQAGTDIDPIRTAGATTSAEDGRRLLLMVCAAFGLPETFFGDVSVGTLATAKSLDRPTELMISNRQTLWTDIYNDILQFVLYYAVSAIDGPLRSFGDVAENEYGETIVNFDTTIDTHIDIDFPSVVERDPAQTIAALVQGATFDSKTPTIIPDQRLLARIVLSVLGEDNIDQLLETMYNEDGTPKIVNTPAVQPGAPAGTPGKPNDPANPDNPAAPGASGAGAPDVLAEAAATLRASIDQLREALYPADRRVSLGEIAPHLSTPAVPEIDIDSFMKP